MSVDEIDLESDDQEITLFTDEEQVTVQQVNHEFTQYSSLKGELRQFTIFNDNQCYQYVKKKYGRKKKFRINLTYLDANPKRQFVLADTWLMLAMIGAILSFLVVYMGWFSGKQWAEQIKIVGPVLFISITLIAFMITALRSSDRVFVVSKYGRIPILELMNKTPEYRSFDEFMKLLGQHITTAQHQAHLSGSNALTLELKELRRLKDEQVISEEHYQQAKKRIFKNKAFKASETASNA